MFVLKIEASKPPIINLKVVPVIEMAFLHTVRHLLVLVRPKIRLNSKHKVQK